MGGEDAFRFTSVLSFSSEVVLFVFRSKSRLDFCVLQRFSSTILDVEMNVLPFVVLKFLNLGSAVNPLTPMSD